MKRGERDRHGVLHGIFRHLFAVDGEHARFARAQLRAIGLEVVHRFHPTLPWFIETFADIKASIRELQMLDREIEAALSTSPHKAKG
jgi:hypothetical protein